MINKEVLLNNLVPKMLPIAAPIEPMAPKSAIVKENVPIIMVVLLAAIIIEIKGSSAPSTPFKSAIVISIVKMPFSFLSCLKELIIVLKSFDY
ncbi:hypothetical protein SDC49_17740 [Lactobacillus sp. R2/2]|nr:hypothetical protein [Lactobacillus sp. R2/2]